MSKELNRLHMYAEAYGDNKPLKRISRKTIPEGRYSYDGYHLSHFEVEAILRSKKDFDDLIELLKVHQYCFTETTQSTENQIKQ